MTDTQTMTIDAAWLTELLPPALAAAIGAYFSARLGVTHAERADSSRYRRESAEELLTALAALRSLLRDARHQRDFGKWAAAVSAVYDTVDDARYRFPQGFRHLKQSIRFALGEAVGGVSWVDLPSSRGRDELSEYNSRWTEYAIDYIDMVMNSVREWRDGRAKTAPKVSLLAFDPWLAKTGRHVSGGGPVRDDTDVRDPRT
jgi:hypothetical protein